MPHKAFFYGTLMASPVLYRIIWGSQTPPTPEHASLLCLRPAILHAHKRHRIKNKKYPAILPAAPSSSVQGMLVEGLTDADLWRLDIFEGNEYARQRVRVSVLNTGARGSAVEGKGDAVASKAQHADAQSVGEEVEADAYIWIDDRDKLDPDEWDLAEFVSEEMKWWVGREATGMREGFQGRASINEVDDAVAALRDHSNGSGTARAAA